MAIINGTNSNNTLLGTGLADTISGLGGNDSLYGFAGKNTLIGGTGYDTYRLTAGINNADTIRINAGDSPMSIVNHLGIRPDTVYGLDKYDKFDLPSAALIGNTSVNTAAKLDTAHIGAYSVSNGIITLKTNAGAAVNINSLALVKEAYHYLQQACLPAHLNHAAVLPVNYQGTHDLLFEAQSTTNVTLVDIVGTSHLSSIVGMVI
jgi:hypothetical protein